MNDPQERVRIQETIREIDRNPGSFFHYIWCVVKLAARNMAADRVGLSFVLVMIFFVIVAILRTFFLRH